MAAPYALRTTSGSTVIVEPAPAPPLFLGGYRDARTGVAYHHGCTQTAREGPPAWASAPVRFERDAQTSGAVASRAAQSRREGVAQTVRRGLHQSVTRDVTRIARPYEDADAHAIRRERAAVRIQCVWRAALARVVAGSLLARRAAAIAAAEAAEAVDYAAAEAADVARRLEPRTAADFAALYDEVEAWRVSSQAALDARLPRATADPAARTAAHAELLRQETAMLRTITRLRTSAARVNEEEAATSRLNSMSQPHAWGLTHVPKAARAPVCTVTTPATVRAAELKRLYDALGLEGLPPDDRAGVLTLVRSTASEFPCGLTREILALVERELDCIARNRPAASTAALRRRTRALWLTFCETPEFNPEAAAFVKAPPLQDPRAVSSLLSTTKLASTAASRAAAAAVEASTSL